MHKNGKNKQQSEGGKGHSCLCDDEVKSGTDILLKSDAQEIKTSFSPCRISLTDKI